MNRLQVLRTINKWLHKRNMEAIKDEDLSERMLTVPGVAYLGLRSIGLRQDKDQR